MGTATTDSCHFRWTPCRVRRSRFLHLSQTALGHIYVCRQGISQRSGCMRAVNSSHNCRLQEYLDRRRWQKAQRAASLQTSWSEWQFGGRVDTSKGLLQTLLQNLASHSKCMVRVRERGSGEGCARLVVHVHACTQECSDGMNVQQGARFIQQVQRTTQIIKPHYWWLDLLHSLNLLAIDEKAKHRLERSSYLLAASCSRSSRVKEWYSTW